MTNIVLKNATIIDPKSPFHKQIVDIKIQEGTIIEIGKNILKLKYGGQKKIFLKHGQPMSADLVSLDHQVLQNQA